MNQERLLNIIISPRLSEKASIATEKRNEYVFDVNSTACKSEIKEAVEALFNTKVSDVRVVNVKGKKKIFKGIKGRKSDKKKAYVTLQSDQKIDLFGAQ